MTEQLSLLSDVADAKVALVVRSADVPVFTDYYEYRPYLRRDFLFSCAYCTLTEFEASGIRFTIDHYEPQAARPDLRENYSNLMYCCGECNLRKGDINPPLAARAAGYRFFRPDQDYYSDHFKMVYVGTSFKLEGLTKPGEFTIENCDLNRLSSRRLREIRERLHQCSRFTAHGIAALRTFRIDQLPPHIKGRALNAIGNSLDVVASLEDQIDDLLSRFSQSELLEEDLEAVSRANARATSLKTSKALFPGSWRTPRKTKNKPKKN